jgi:hypothetical protein
VSKIANPTYDPATIYSLSRSHIIVQQNLIKGKGESSTLVHCKSEEISLDGCDRTTQ